MESSNLIFNFRPDWNTAKQVMSDVNFLKKLQDFDANHIPESTIKKLKPYIENKDFQPAIVEKVSKTARSMCAWAIAMNKYAEVFKDIEPKIRKREGAEKELRQVLAILKQKQNQLAEVEAKIQMLKDDLDKKQKEMQDIQDRYDLNSVRLNRAGRLTSALSDEEVRWRETVAELNRELYAVPGDVLVASACIAYLGAFSVDYRKRMSSEWISECQRLNIPSSSEFDFVYCLGEPYKMREWNMHGLPRDEVSIENGIIVTQASRWPLMIDPQEQANRWIRNMEKDNNLIITKMSDPSLTRVLEMAIRKGTPVLLEELGDTIDPSLQPVLARSLHAVPGGRLMMRFGDADIDYDENFRLYMTTKLSNPHYLPEVCIQVTLVNFLVSVSGLEDQLLTDIVRIELPDMERQRNDLIVSINTDKQQLILLEDKILKLLFASKGNILDDEELVDTLNESKETAIVVASRLVDAEKTEEFITLEREKYRPLAAQGAVLFFVVSSLAEIDPMYQFSLRYFTQVFCSVIEVENEKADFDKRIEFLMTEETRALYLNIGRGLFERHKLIFSFLLATAIEKHHNRLSETEISFLLRGPVGFKAEPRDKPEELVGVTEEQWISCLHLDYEFEEFRNLPLHLDEKISIQLGDFNQEFELVPNPNESSEDWNQILSPFKKLMMISVLKPELLVTAISSYVRLTLGREFTESKGISLHSVFQDTSSVTPLIFVLSTGSDPMNALQKFAQEKEFAAKLHSISLGQGQGAVAESLIKKGCSLGHWIFLQNCHLATSWMPKMEAIVRSMALGDVKIHPEYRLFLSSMPATTFPISVLQNSVKLTNEPPKGLRSNLLRSLSDLDEEHFEVHILNEKWRAMLFGICMFHGIILERRKFGSLGFNILYEFSESDRECALKTFDMFVDREKKREIPWQALEYINGEITYGGRVTDEWDQRCLKAILKSFSSQRILLPDYSYSESGIYKCPEVNTLKEFKNYAEQLPFNELPEVFGMHGNANIIYQTKETRFFITTLLEGQPKASSESGGVSNDDIALEMIAKIKKLIVKSISLDNIQRELLKLDEKNRPAPLTTVLLQEVERFNKLLKILHGSLNDLEKAIKGFVVMSESLENIFEAFLNNRVPLAWSQKGGFLSTKTLANWIKDFAMRIEAIDSWINNGLPRSAWIPGMFFPQSFLTGILQTYARKHNLPIDSLRFDFEVLSKTLNQQKIYELREDGEAETRKLYEGLDYPEDGIIIHGLFIEAGKWDEERGGLCDPEIGDLTPRLPALWLKPCTELTIGTRFDAPLYKTPVRAGVLSTTGHSTNFVLSILLKSDKPPEFWILRGTALVTLISD